MNTTINDVLGDISVGSVYGVYEIICEGSFCYEKRLATYKEMGDARLVADDFVKAGKQMMIREIPILSEAI